MSADEQQTLSIVFDEIREEASGLPLDEQLGFIKGAVSRDQRLTEVLRDALFAMLMSPGVAARRAEGTQSAINFTPVINNTMARDSYTTGQAGAVGPNAMAQHMSFQQLWQQNSAQIDLSRLAADLATLRAAMRSEATEPEHDQALGAIASAETAAKEGNGAKALEYLKGGGKWAMDVATKIGVAVAAGAIRTSLGMN
jgi:hypothetical protein